MSYLLCAAVDERADELRRSQQLLEDARRSVLARRAELDQELRELSELEGAPCLSFNRDEVQKDIDEECSRYEAEIAEGERSARPVRGQRQTVCTANGGRQF